MWHAGSMPKIPHGPAKGAVLETALCIAVCSKFAVTAELHTERKITLIVFLQGFKSF